MTRDFTQEWLREGQVLGCVTTLKNALRGCKVVPLGAVAPSYALPIQLYWHLEP